MENSNKLIFFNVAAFISVLSTSLASSEVPRPRGVSLSRASLYNTDKDFVCFDGGLTIPFGHVNDDYCDCADASDEPGTSACPHGTFHCTNAGHKPLNIASSRVNDGVCDCCDASDEYAYENSKCVNTCNELGRSAREEAQRKAELIKAGKQLRTELIQRGAQLKQEKKEKLAELEKSKIEAEKVKLEKEDIKKQIEELENASLQKYRQIEDEERKQRQEAEAARNKEEALEAFARYDSNGDGRVDAAELKTRQTFDKDRDGEVSDEEVKFFFADLESVDEEEFVANAWSKMKPFVMMDAGLFKPPSPIPETTSDEQPDAEDEEVITNDSHEDGDEGEDGDGDEDEDAEETPEEKPDETKLDPPKYDEETQSLIDRANKARSVYNEAEKDVRDIQSEIKSIEEYLEKDLGVDEEFATLEGECFEYADYEYIYKLCPFEKAVQKPKTNSVETRLGTWSKWIGPENDKYSDMLYDRGQSCWNGPQRSTQVHVSCGSENKLTSVSEPNRCEYLFEFVTPAACRDVQQDQADDVHDEL